jgi:hypothetical protein
MWFLHYKVFSPQCWKTVSKNNIIRNYIRKSHKETVHTLYKHLAASNTTPLLDAISDYLAIMTVSPRVAVTNFRQPSVYEHEFN